MALKVMQPLTSCQQLESSFLHPKFQLGSFYKKIALPIVQHFFCNNKGLAKSQFKLHAKVLTSFPHYHYSNFQVEHKLKHNHS